MEIQDKTGHPINVGDFLAYGHALGRSAGLRFGKVLDIKPRTARYNGDPGVAITVIGVDEGWRGPSLCSRVGTLQYPDRTIVLEPERMPAELKGLLDAFVWEKK